MGLLSFLLGLVWVIALGYLLLLAVALILKIFRRNSDDYNKKRGIAVLVVGDVGRSPRMQNHALCISKNFCSSVRKERFGKRKGIQEYKSDKINNNHVYLIGYNESICRSSVLMDKNITIVDIGKPLVDQHRKKIPLFAFFLFKIVEQSGRIFLRLMNVPNLGGIILQAPPSIPAIPICILVSLLRGASFIVDWHNYGHTLLIKEKERTNLGSKGVVSWIEAMSRNILVTGYKFFEFYFGRYSGSSFCVSKAMQKDLASRGIEASVLYDKPNEEFTPISSISKRHYVLFKYFGFEKETGFNAETLNRNGEIRVNKGTEGGIGSSHSSLTGISDVILTGKGRASVLIKLFRDLDDKMERTLFKGTQKVGDNAPILKMNPSTLESSLFVEKINLKLDKEEVQRVFDVLKIEDSFSEESGNTDFAEDCCLVDIKEETPVSELSLVLNRVSGSYELEIKTNIKEERPCVLITSTSWTPDEDIDLLLESLVLYDKAIDKDRSKKSEKSSGTHKKKTLPDLFLIITGKGPMKSEWIQKASGTGMKHVSIRTVFVEADDYPKILASSDLGISLHYSSSGLDLPMKVVDMVGAGIPVISFRYQTMNELLFNNGDPDIFFDNPGELCERLNELLEGFGDVLNKDSYPTSCLRRIVKQNNSRKHKTFMEEWIENAASHFENIAI
ncbi:ALG1 like beta-1 [Cryptosporidium ryanae]|uniref:ALG1 like beta-1 n=1 Tax=Cryptosporidium ryanae TaxID=515981 RepID=UPI00351A67D4|nr:ALG1 like beta-1 [Cryptosporidium ryanae]